MPGQLTDQEYAAQFQPGRGVTGRYGPKPPTPDEVAARGTPEWRAAFNKQDEWRRFQTHSGATAFDMGLRDAKDLGKHYFTRMREGTVDPRERNDWVKSNEGWGRGSFKPNDDMLYGQSGRVGPGNLERQQQDPGVPEGVQDMWPGGQEGSLPQYAAPQYNPVDSWGGWSGVYGNSNPSVTQSNPAGMSSSMMQPPASVNSQRSGYDGSGIMSGATKMGLPINSNSGANRGGYDGSGIMGGINRAGGGLKGPGFGGSAQLNPSKMAMRRRNPTQGGSFGGPNMRPPQPQGMNPQSMLIRR